MENSEKVEFGLVPSTDQEEVFGIIDQDTLFLIDSDVDQSESIIYQIIKSRNDAFSRPSVVCKHIDKIPHDKMIRVIINTRGGALCHLEKILKKLLQHKSGYVVYIKNECYSAGAVLALGAKEIVMNDDSYIGKIDPQDNNGQIIIFTQIPPKYVSTHNINTVMIAQNVLNYTKKILDLINLPNGTRELVDEHLLYSKLPHEALFNFDECRDLIKLNVRKPEPSEHCYFQDHSTESYKLSSGKKMNYIVYLVIMLIILSAIGFFSIGHWAR